MSALWTRDEALAATGGEALGPDWAAGGVSIDTRTLKPRDLFVALKDQRDGHDFVGAALEAGAAAALVSHVPDGVAPDAPLLVVDDVLTGLERMGRVARARTLARVIAVTGSAGKTSTKEMLAHVLGRQGLCHAAEASYNNHWGVPLTLARMPRETEFAVIEIGMNHPGEIAPLARQARPHIAIVTTVSEAHLEAFSNLREIAVEKANIFQGVESGGVAIFNADLETSHILETEAARLALREVGFGETAGAVLFAKRIALTADASVVEGQCAGVPFLLKVGAPGRHFAMNALAVYGAVKFAGADTDVAAIDIGTWRAPKGRGLRERVRLDAVEDHWVELIDDAFNANPASMDAAFEVLATVTPRGRRIAILGDMLELGPDEAAMHAALAEHPAMAEIDRVDCVGPRMKALYAALPGEKRGTWVETAEELAETAHRLVEPGDVVLVKGSKGARVSRIVDAIRSLDRAGANGAESETA